MVDAADDWTIGYFDDWYMQLLGFPPDEISDREVDSLCNLLQPPPARVLDAACGPGRHASRLAARDYDVVGLDSSAYFCGLLRDAAAARGVNVDVIEADLREIACDGQFDAVLNLQTAWGYYDDDENQRGLNAMGAALRPGGILALELAHRDGLLAGYAPRDWKVLEDGTIIWAERSFDPVAGVNTAVHRWRHPDGKSGQRHHRLRLYTATELDRMLRAVGLVAEAWYSGFALTPLTRDARRVLVIARKPASVDC
jgi:SAM-dependent methyltransferase